MRNFFIRRASKEKSFQFFYVSALFFLLFTCSSVATENGATVSDVEFKANFDDSMQRYLEILPKNFDAARPATLLLVLHGHGSDRTQITSESVAEFRAMRDLAAERGAIVVSPDYRARTSWFGPAAEADVVQIVETLKSKYSIKDVVASGASMGGSSALTFAALRPDLIDGVISMNGTANHLEYENFQDAISASFGGSKTEIPDEYKKRSAEYFPERLVDFPVALTLGGKDDVVPFDSAVRLANVLKKIGGDVYVLYRPDGGHSTTYEDASEAGRFVFDRLENDAPSAENDERK